MVKCAVRSCKNDSRKHTKFKSSVTFHRNKKDVQLSKSLSWLLRHGAEKEGFTISAEGYIEVNQILKHKCFVNYTLNDIKRVVANNEKQRFKLRTNQFNKSLEIKANQGHSISCVTDDDLTPITEPIYKTVVHGTYMKCWPQIKANGLCRMRRKHIHFAKGVPGDSNVISGLRRDVQLLVYVDLQKALADGILFYESDNGVLLTAGNAQGYLETKYFHKVIKVNTAVPVAMETASVPISTPRTNRDPSTGNNSAVKPRRQRGNSHQNVTDSPKRNLISETFYNSRANNTNNESTAAARSAHTNERGPPLPAQQPHNQNNENNKRKVLITGFPSYTQPAELSRVLNQFGNLTIEKCKNRLAVVEFGSEQEAANALSANNQVVIYGEFINIKRYTNAKRVDDMIKANRRINSEQKDDLISPKDIDLSGDFYAQVERIQSAIRLTREEVTGISALYADVELVLQQLYPGCVCVPFGSITTGLGVKSSDADCFVQLPPRFLGAGYDVSFVHRCRRLLAAHERFAELVAIPRANTPILKFLHRPTRMRCDLSCKTPLGTVNSRLLAYLLRRDARLLPAALLLKYWARVQRLSGSGRLTNYALTLLLVFYLQAGAGLLPAVRRLQAASAAPHLIDEWDAAFLAEPPPPPPPLPALPDLFGGFFRFYAEFDFDSLVVCPFLGEPVPKAAFENENAPPAFVRYLAAVRARRAAPLRHTSALCVQDPFEHSHNVASGVSPRLAAQIVAALRAAAQAYEAARPTCAALLPAVLTPPAPAPRRVRVRVPARLLLRLPAESWRDEVRALLLDVVFARLIDLRLQPEAAAGDEAKAEGESGAEGEGDGEEEAEGEDGAEGEKGAEGESSTERYWATAAVALWARRKFVNPRGVSAAGLVLREQAVTARLAETAELRLRSPLVLQVKLTFRERPRSLALGAELQGAPEWLPSLAKFLHVVEQSWLPILMRPSEPLEQS